ncbi:MAG: hypothetical protein M3Z20_02805 [Chloroflexota bacterium]|nr:hypothetical protein [Chloroflexota bacterium]
MHVMDSAFADALADWVPFYALAGAAAATLLGLLFVAVSLRLAIFRDPETADVSYFATFIFANMLGALIVSGLALVPHESSRSLAIPLVVLGVIGLIMLATLIRLTYRLNPRNAAPNPGITPWTLSGWALLGSMLAPVVLMLISAWLVAVGDDAAFRVLALTEGLLLILPTGSAWLLVTHAAPGA